MTGSPTAPTGVVAVGGTPAPSGDLNVTWSAPASSGLGTIVSYTATSSTGSKTCTSTSTAPATPALACQLTGLTNGTSYTVTVTATNSVGTAYKSVASAPSPAAFPSTTFGAPTIGTATGWLPAGDGQLDRSRRAGRDPAASDRLRGDAVHRYDRPAGPDVQQHGDDRDA